MAVTLGVIITRYSPGIIMLTFLASALLLPTSAQATSSPTYMLPESSNLHVDISPDNKSIVFTSYTNDSNHNGEIWLMNLETKQGRKIGEGDDPAFSADGKMIAFARKPEGEDLREIYTMDADGKNVKRLTTTDFECRDPSWRPDGSGILFVATDEDYTFYNPWHASIADGKFGSIPWLEISSAVVYHPKTADLYYCHSKRTENDSSRKAVFVRRDILGVLSVFREPISEQYEIDSCAISWDGKYIGYMIYDTEASVHIVAMEAIESDIVKKADNKLYLEREMNDFGEFPAIQSLCVGNGGKFVIVSALTDRKSSRLTLFMLQGDKRIQLTNGK